MNRQEYFDFAVRHLSEQGVPSYVPSIAQDTVVDCAYRSPEGHKCIIGAMIKDEHYNPAFENQNVYGEVVSALNASLGKVIPRDYSFLNSLQTVHDKWAQKHYETKELNIDYLVSLFKTFADYYNLDDSIVTTLEQGT